MEDRMRFGLVGLIKRNRTERAQAIGIDIR